MTRMECQARATDCLMKAENATEPQRTKLIEIAHAWQQLADEGVTMMPNGPVFPPLEKVGAKG